MTGRAAFRLVLLAAAFAAGTVLAGWWALPALGLIWGWLNRTEPRVAVKTGGAAALGWAFLLLWSATRGPVVRLANTAGAVMGLPGVALLALTLVFAAVLAWAGAGLALAFPATPPNKEAKP